MKRNDLGDPPRGEFWACVVAALAMTVVASRPSSAALVLHLDFELPSDLIRDVSGNDAVGAVTQITPTSATPAGELRETANSAVGNFAAFFNPATSGTNGFAVEFADSELPDLGADNNFAVSYWINPTNEYLGFSPNHASFSSIASGADATLSFQLENKGDTSTGQVGVSRFSGPFEAPLIDASTNLDALRWQHVAVVSNGQSGRVQLYYDGALTQDINTADLFQGVSTGLALNEVYLGMNRGRSKLFFGALDDVRIYDTAAVSEVLSIANSVIPRLEVDRETGAAAISIPVGGAALQVTSYTIESTVGVLDPTAWQPVSGVTGTPDSLTETFSARSLTPGAPLGLGSIWRAGPFEDLVASIGLSNGTTLALPVAFVGNGGDDFLLGDLFETGDGIDLDDWRQFKSGLGADLSAASRIDAYRMGDLDGDGDNDGVDFALFEEAFDNALFPGALAKLLSVPEPTALSLVGCAAIGLLARRLRPTAVVAACCLGLPSPANAQLLVYDGFDTSTLPNATDLDGTLGGQSSFGWGSNTWTDTVGRNDQPFISQSPGLDSFPGLKSVDGYATRPIRNGRTAINRQIGSSEQAMLTGSGEEFWFSVVIANRDTPDQHDEAVFLFAETPLVDFRDFDFAGGFTSIGGTPTPTPGFQSIGVMFDDGNNDSNNIGTPENPDEGFGDGNRIYAVYTDGSGDPAVYSDGFKIGVANEPHLIIGHVSWGAEGDDHQYDIYALGVEDVADPLAPLELPAAPFGSLTIPAASVTPNLLDTLGFAGAKLPAYDEVRFGLTVDDVIPPPDRLTLEVNVATGAVTLKNDTSAAFPIDYLELGSDAGSLDPAGWISLSDSNQFPTGNNDGSGWEEGGNNDVSQLIEAYLLGASTIAPGAAVPLGQAFAPGSTRDLRLAYHLDTAAAVIDGGIVEYVSVAGDYNLDSVVDAADYTVWRDTLGDNVEPGSGADGDQDGQITIADYSVWRQAFAPAGASATAAPEPTSTVIAAAAVVSAAFRLRITRPQTA